MSLLLGTLAAAPLSSADMGVGVGGSPITLGHAALTGETYSMTPLYVVNTGTEPARYSISAQRLSTGDEQPVPTEWIQLGDNDFILAPQQSVYVPVTLAVPGEAAPGTYLTNLTAAAGSPSAAGGAALGAAAATTLTFTVVEAPSAAAQLFQSFSSWLPTALAGVALVIGAALLLRALGMRVQLDRKP